MVGTDLGTQQFLLQSPGSNLPQQRPQQQQQPGIDVNSTLTIITPCSVASPSSGLANFPVSQSNSIRPLQVGMQQNLSVFSRNRLNLQVNLENLHYFVVCNDFNL